MDASPTQPSTTDRRIGARALLVLFCAGLLMRLLRFDELQLQHFDEGVYALRAAQALGTPLGEVLRGNVYDNHFAPPLFYALVTGAYAALSTTAAAAVLVSAVAGAVAVPLTALLGAEVAGRRTGLVAAGLLAVTEYHLLYSRMALTDAAFATWFLVALWALFRHERTRGRGALALAAAATAFACWTKYTGVIVPALFLAGALVCCVKPEGRKHLRGRVTSSAVLVLAALAACLPLAWQIATAPGWGAWLAYRAHHTAIETPLTSLYGSALHYGASLLLWVPWPVLALAAGGLWVLARRGSPNARLVLVITGLYALSTVAYHKYPRLLLPIVPLVLVAAGAAAADLWRVWEERPMRRAALVLLLLASLAWPLPRALRTPEVPYEKLLTATARARERLRPPPNVYIVDAVPVAFYAARVPEIVAPFRRVEYPDLERRAQRGERFLVVLDRPWPKAPLAGARTLAEFPTRYTEVELANRYGAPRVLAARFGRSLPREELRLRLALVAAPGP